MPSLRPATDIHRLQQANASPSADPSESTMTDKETERSMRKAARAERQMEREAERSAREFARDPYFRAQQNLATARCIERMDAEQVANVDRDQMEIFYKVTDPIHHFTMVTDDLISRPRESPSAYQRRRMASAQRKTARFLKKYPNHTQGQIDRASTIGWAKTPKVKAPILPKDRTSKGGTVVNKKEDKSVTVKSSASKGKRYTDKQRQDILKYVAANGTTAASKKYGVSTQSIYSWKQSSGGKQAKSRDDASAVLKRIKNDLDTLGKMLLGLSGVKAQMEKIKSAIKEVA